MDSIHHLHNLNPWAILVSALIQWFIGALWYSPALFAKPWMAMVNPPSGPNKKKVMIIGMLCSFGGSMVLSFVLWHTIAVCSESAPMVDKSRQSKELLQMSRPRESRACRNASPQSREL